MSGYKVTIASSQDYKLLFGKVLNTFNELQPSELNEKTVFIQVDLSFPEGFPTVFNPNLLKSVIDFCLSAGVKKIIIGGVPLFGLSSRYVWNSLGFANFFEKDNVEFIALEEDDIKKNEFEIGKKKIKINYPAVVIDADFYISLVNPRLDMDFNLNSTIHSSLSLLSWKERYNLLQAKPNNKNNNLEEYLGDLADSIAEIYLIRQPNISIIDISSLSNSFGPFLYSDSKLMGLNYSLIANNGIIGDIVALEMCKFEISKNETIKAIEKRDPSLTDKKNIGSMSLFELEDSKIKEFNVKKDYFSKDSAKNDNTNLKPSKPEDILKSQELQSLNEQKGFPMLNNVIEFPSIDKIFPEKSEICSGKLCPGCKNAAIQLLYLLKSAFIKDIESLDEFSFVIGKNPPENEKKTKIIVFGDCAINSTVNQDFRIKKIQKKVRTERQVEKARIKYQAGIREKILEWESKMASIEENIKIQIKDPQKQQKAIESLKKKDEKLRNKMEQKNKKYLEKEEKRRQKEIEKGKIIKYRINKGVIEVPGCPPNGFEYLIEIIKFFKKTWTPTLSFWNNIMNLFYDRAEFELFYQTFIKERQEIIKVPEEKKITE